MGKEVEVHYDEEGRPHSDGDKPAVIWADGGKEWWRHGKLIGEVEE